jgi:hypothetical protein
VKYLGSHTGELVYEPECATPDQDPAPRAVEDMSQVIPDNMFADAHSLGDFPILQT